MTGLLGCAIIFLLSHLNASVLGADTVTEAFNKHGVVPDVVSVAPNHLVKVVYASNIEVSLGNELQTSQMLVAPVVSFEADSNSSYTLAMVDPDVPSRKLPLAAQFVHWLVGNIPGDNVSRGQTLAVYLPPTPAPLTGLHRYVYLVYEQSNPIQFNTEVLDFTTTQLRGKFSISDFAKKNALGDLLFGNFCEARTLPLAVL